MFPKVSKFQAEKKPQMKALDPFKTRICAIGSINSHYLHVIGDKLINPIVGVYIPIRWWQLKDFLEFSPRKWGEMIQFDGPHILKMGGEKPPTRKPSNLQRSTEYPRSTAKPQNQKTKPQRNQETPRSTQPPMLYGEKHRRKQKSHKISKSPHQSIPNKKGC